MADLKRPIPLLLEVEGVGLYQGWNLKINGVPMYHKPYDGSDSEAAAEEFLIALGALMRRETGRPVSQVTESDET